jgi:glycosyltransferase involved in cell wall biosynthesis
LASPTVFLTSTERASFVLDDAEILRRHFGVDLFIGHGAGAIGRIVRGAMRADVSISWLGSTYSAAMVAAARLAGRRSIIILGGVDVADEPELGYGLWRSPLKSRLLRWALSHASAVYVVADRLREDLRARTGWSCEAVATMPTGYDPTAWRPRYPKETRVLSVAGCDTVERFRVKGVDLLIEAARLAPELSFTLIGVAPALPASLGIDIPSNLTLLPALDRAALAEHYAGALLFCLPSRREGLPNALCEAMLSGCIPVASDVGDVRSALDGSGYLVVSGSAEELAAALRLAAGAAEIDGLRSRRSIAMRFSRDDREKNLIEAVRTLLYA